MSPRSDDKMVAEEKALSDGLSLMLQNWQPAPGTSLGLVSKDLDQGPLHHEHLVDIQQNAARFYYHPLYCQVLSDGLSFFVRFLSFSCKNTIL